MVRQRAPKLETDALTGFADVDDVPRADRAQPLQGLLDLRRSHIPVDVRADAVEGHVVAHPRVNRVDDQGHDFVAVVPARRHGLVELPNRRARELGSVGRERRDVLGGEHAFKLDQECRRVLVVEGIPIIDRLGTIEHAVEPRSRGDSDVAGADRAKRGEGVLHVAGRGVPSQRSGGLALEADGPRAARRVGHADPLRHVDVAPAAVRHGADVGAGSERRHPLLGGLLIEVIVFPLPRPAVSIDFLDDVPVLIVLERPGSQRARFAGHLVQAIEVPHGLVAVGIGERRLVVVQVPRKIRRRAVAIRGARPARKRVERARRGRARRVDGRDQVRKDVVSILGGLAREAGAGHGAAQAIQRAGRGQPHRVGGLHQLRIGVVGPGRHRGGHTRPRRRVDFLDPVIEPVVEKLGGGPGTVRFGDQVPVQVELVGGGGRSVAGPAGGGVRQNHLGLQPVAVVAVLRDAVQFVGDLDQLSGQVVLEQDGGPRGDPVRRGLDGFDLLVEGIVDEIGAVAVAIDGRKLVTVFIVTPGEHGAGRAGAGRKGAVGRGLLLAHQLALASVLESTSPSGE